MFDMCLPVESVVDKEPQPPDGFGLDLKCPSGVLPFELPTLIYLFGWAPRGMGSRKRLSLKARLVRWIELGARLLERGKRGQITLGD